MHHLRSFAIIGSLLAIGGTASAGRLGGGGGHRGGGGGGHVSAGRSYSRGGGRAVRGGYVGHRGYGDRGWADRWGWRGGYVAPAWGWSDPAYGYYDDGYIDPGYVDPGYVVAPYGYASPGYVAPRLIVHPRAWHRGYVHLR